DLSPALSLNVSALLHGSLRNAGFLPAGFGTRPCLSAFDNRTPGPGNSFGQGRLYRRRGLYRLLSKRTNGNQNKQYRDNKCSGVSHSPPWAISTQLQGKSCRRVSSHLVTEEGTTSEREPQPA